MVLQVVDLSLWCRGTVPGLPGSGMSNPVNQRRRKPHTSRHHERAIPESLADCLLQNTLCVNRPFHRDSLAASYSPTDTHRECALTLVEVARLTCPVGESGPCLPSEQGHPLNDVPPLDRSRSITDGGRFVETALMTRSQIAGSLRSLMRIRDQQNSDLHHSPTFRPSESMIS